MKTLSEIGLILVIILGSYTANAQATMPSRNDSQTYRDGVAMKFGKMVKYKDGKEMALTSTYTAENGTRVSPNGMVTFKGGKKEKLAEGYAINKQGNKVILADDMIAPDMIREHQKKITGKDASTITFSEKTKTTINEETGRKAVRDTVRTRTSK